MCRVEPLQWIITIYRSTPIKVLYPDSTHSIRREPTKSTAAFMSALGKRSHVGKAVRRLCIHYHPPIQDIIRILSICQGITCISFFADDNSCPELRTLACALPRLHEVHANSETLQRFMDDPLCDLSQWSHLGIVMPPSLEPSSIPRLTAARLPSLRYLYLMPPPAHTAEQLNEALLTMLVGVKDIGIVYVALVIDEGKLGLLQDVTERLGFSVFTLPMAAAYGGWDLKKPSPWMVAKDMLSKLKGEEMQKSDTVNTLPSC